MATLSQTYNQISNSTFKCWNGFVMHNEQVRPNGIAFYDNKHNRKSVQLRLKDDIVQEIDY